MRIFVSGSLAFDRIMDFPGRFVDHILPEKIHILNVCFMVNGLTERFGGTAGNIAYNLALLEEKPVIVATAGRDFGPYREWLEGLGLPLTGIKEIPGEFTAGAYITTDLADNQITGFNPGAMKHTSDYRFDDLDPAAALAIVAPGSLEDMRIYSRAYKDRGVRYIFDPGQSIPAWDGDALKEMADGALALIVNDYELEMFRQKTGLDIAGILKFTPHLITTRGEQGSLVQTDRGIDDVPAVPPSRVLDPTGAGDAYRAGLLKGLALGLGWPEAARMGAVLASFAYERGGGAWEGHRQAMRVNGFVFYNSELSFDAIRTAWQPFELTAVGGQVSLTYAGQTVAPQPARTGDWRRPAVVRLGVKGPGRGVSFSELQFAAEFAGEKQGP